MEQASVQKTIDHEKLGGRQLEKHTAAVFQRIKIVRQRKGIDVKKTLDSTLVS